MSTTDNILLAEIMRGEYRREGHQNRKLRQKELETRAKVMVLEDSEWKLLMRSMEKRKPSVTKQLLIRRVMVERENDKHSIQPITTTTLNDNLILSETIRRLDQRERSIRSTLETQLSVADCELKKYHLGKTDFILNLRRGSPITEPTDSHPNADGFKQSYFARRTHQEARKAAALSMNFSYTGPKFLGGSGGKSILLRTLTPGQKVLFKNINHSESTDRAMFIKVYFSQINRLVLEKQIDFDKSLQKSEFFKREYSKRKWIYDKTVKDLSKLKDSEISKIRVIIKLSEHHHRDIIIEEYCSTLVGSAQATFRVGIIKSEKSLFTSILETHDIGLQATAIAHEESQRNILFERHEKKHHLTWLIFVKETHVISQRERFKLLQKRISETLPGHENSCRAAIAIKESRVLGGIVKTMFNSQHKLLRIQGFRRRKETHDQSLSLRNHLMAEEKYLHKSIKRIFVSEHLPFLPYIEVLGRRGISVSAIKFFGSTHQLFTTTKQRITSLENNRREQWTHLLESISNESLHLHTSLYLRDVTKAVQLLYQRENHHRQVLQNQYWSVTLNIPNSKIILKLGWLSEEESYIRHEVEIETLEALDSSVSSIKETSDAAFFALMELRKLEGLEQTNRDDIIVDEEDCVGIVKVKHSRRMLSDFYSKRELKKMKHNDGDGCPETITERILRQNGEASRSESRQRKHQTLQFMQPAFCLGAEAKSRVGVSRSEKIIRRQITNRIQYYLLLRINSSRSPLRSILGNGFISTLYRYSLSCGKTTPGLEALVGMNTSSAVTNSQISQFCMGSSNRRERREENISSEQEQALLSIRQQDYVGALVHLQHSDKRRMRLHTQTHLESLISTRLLDLQYARLSRSVIALAVIPAIYCCCFNYKIHLIQRLGRASDIRQKTLQVRERRNKVKTLSSIYQLMVNDCGLGFVMSMVDKSNLAIHKTQRDMYSDIRHRWRVEKDLYFQNQKNVLMLGLPLLLSATVGEAERRKESQLSVPLESIIASSGKFGGGLVLLSQCKSAGKLSLGLCIRAATKSVRSLLSGLVWSQCASVLQKAGRGLIRRRIANNRYCYNMCSCAAVSIQSWWRGLMGRKHAKKVRIEQQERRAAVAHYENLLRTFPPGSWIEAHGLSQSEFLNGKHARVIRWRVEDVVVTFLSPRKTAAVPIKNVRGVQ